MWFTAFCVCSHSRTWFIVCYRQPCWCVFLVCGGHLFDSRPLRRDPPPSFHEPWLCQPSGIQSPSKSHQIKNSHWCSLPVLSPAFPSSQHQRPWWQTTQRHILRSATQWKAEPVNPDLLFSRFGKNLINSEYVLWFNSFLFIMKYLKIMTWMYLCCVW